jgi:hypothetical protein
MFATWQYRGPSMTSLTGGDARRGVVQKFQACAKFDFLRDTLKTFSREEYSKAAGWVP